MRPESGALKVILLSVLAPVWVLADPMPSWQDGGTKSAIVSFVDDVTDPAGESFVPVSDRIAVFDNDGTLWSEQPFYFQALFAMEMVSRRSADDPKILRTDALKAAASGDLGALLEQGEHGLLEVVDVSHSDITVSDFQSQARDWLYSTNHPTRERPYSQMVYQPMLELLMYLRDRDFKTFIVSGGGADFIRAFAEDIYGIPPYQVIGSVGNHSYEIDNGEPVVRKESGVSFVDDKAGKPVGIMRQIGMRPIFVGGNSDGDFEMLEWATAGPGPRFGLLVHHTDAEREWAYDRDSPVGRLARGLDEGPDRGWMIVDMRRDWRRIYP